MAITVRAHFSDGHEKTFTCRDDEEATLLRDNLIDGGHQEKEGGIHTFYPATSIVKIVTIEN